MAAWVSSVDVCLYYYVSGLAILSPAPWGTEDARGQESNVLSLPQSWWVSNQSKFLQLWQGRHHLSIKGRAREEGGHGTKKGRAHVHTILFASVHTGVGWGLVGLVRPCQLIIVVFSVTSYHNLAFCDYWRFGTGGHQENVNAVCILALNIINDKVGYNISTVCPSPSHLMWRETI